VASRRSRWTGELFVNSARAHLDNADDKIVFDRYHVMGYLNKAVDTVRKQENRALVAQGDKTLSGSKYLWLYGAENVPAKHESRFAALRDTDLKTGRAWAIKESLRHFWEYVQRGWALRHWNKWYFWATHSRLAPVIEAARTLKRHESGLSLLRPSRHQRRSRGAQFTGASDPRFRSWVSQSRALQNRHLFPPRWIGRVICKVPEGSRVNRA
jgi:hypothetical protein